MVVQAHADFVKSIAMVRDYLITASSDRTIKVWRVGETRPLQTVRHHARPVDAIAVLGTSVWTGDSLGKVSEWRLDNELVHVRDCESHETSVTGILATEDGLWTTSMDKTARFNGEERQVLEHGQYVRCVLAFDNYVITGADDIWVWEDGKALSRVPGFFDVTFLLRWGNSIVSGGLDGTIRFWTIQGGS